MQLSLQAYQETLLHHPGARLRLLEPTRAYGEGRASPCNSCDARRDVSSLMSHVIAPLLLIGSSAKINLMSWKSFPGTQAPASALFLLQRAGQQLPRCPVAAVQQPRTASAGRQWGFRLVLPSCAGGVQECVQGCSPSREQAAPSYPVTTLMLKVRARRRLHLGRISHLRFSALTSAQRKGRGNPVSAAGARRRRTGRGRGSALAFCRLHSGIRLS